MDIAHGIYKHVLLVFSKYCFQQWQSHFQKCGYCWNFHCQSYFQEDWRIIYFVWKTARYSCSTFRPANYQQQRCLHLPLMLWWIEPAAKTVKQFSYIRFWCHICRFWYCCILISPHRNQLQIATTKITNESYCIYQPAAKIVKPCYNLYHITYYNLYHVLLQTLQIGYLGGSVHHGSKVHVSLSRRCK